MQQPPAICEKCGTVFPSGVLIGPGAKATLSRIWKRCPNPECDGYGSIPDGIYDYTDGALTILSTWSPERLQRLIDALNKARNAPDPTAAVEEVIRQDPELEPLWQRLSPLRDASAFYAFLTFLLTVAMLYLMLHGSGGTTIEHQTVINHDTVIQQVINDRKATVPGK